MKLDLAIARFWFRLAPRWFGKQCCWYWTGCLVKTTNGRGDGYGKVKFLGKTWRTHVLAFTLVYGPVEPGQVIRHLCNNRRCCNPEHLKAGTQKENMADRRAREALI